MKATGGKRKLPKSDADSELQLPDDSLEILESSDEELSENEYESSEDSGVEEDSNLDKDIDAPVESSTAIGSTTNQDGDTSDEEDARNTVGNIPMQWYENFPHIGYNLEGKKILKPIKNMDELDKFLDKMDNPDYWKTIYDETTGRDHKLNEDELQLIGRLKSGRFYNSTIDPYEPYVDFFTHEKMIHPINNQPEHKRSFVPSLDERLKVGKLVHAIKMGWLKPRKEKSEDDDQPVFYDLWAEAKDDHLSHSQIARRKMHIPAPKVKLPGHEASYNPPPEYLMTEEERITWEAMDPEERRIDLIPQKYDSLRKVPQYPRFIQDAFSRCLDLYLCPRQRKMRVNVDPEDLIPKLPKPSELQPFPTAQTMCYKGHENIIRSISVHGSGQWIASGSDDKTVRVWEVSTGRCLRTIHMKDVVKCVAWCTNLSVCLLAAVVADTVVVINPYVGDRLISQATDQLLNSYEEEAVEEDEDPEKQASNRLIPWTVVEPGPQFKEGIRLVLEHGKPVSKVTWHCKGDYFATVLPGNGHTQVMLHQLTKRRSQNPFSKCKGLVQCVLFHPNRPFLFVATQTYIRVYNLIKQALTKKLIANAKWISSIAVHPKGDDVLVGSYDGRLMWFDMDLSVKPYQTLRYHKRAIRSCCYHKHYPLFASCADDGTIIVSHGMVYSDLLQNPLIVPVKVLKGHRVERNLGVLDCCFHPTQPWIFSSAADNTIRLFS